MTLTFTFQVGAVGRIAAVGPDATALKPGDLVLVDVYLRARDNDDARCLFGLHQGASEASARLVEGEWRNGTYAQYVKVPLENCYIIPEDGREVHEWAALFWMLIGFGGLTYDGGVDVKPGESIVVAPATGQFSGSAVEVALAMGAQVIAMGRNTGALEKLQRRLSEYGTRLRTVPITGDVDADTRAIGPVDCYLDLSPPYAKSSTHLKSCFKALKPHGRACLMGGILGEIPISNWDFVHDGLKVTGKWMYERHSVFELINMVNVGVVKLGRDEHYSFTLDEWQEALENGEQKMRWGQMTTFKP